MHQFRTNLRTLEFSPDWFSGTALFDGVVPSIRARFTDFCARVRNRYGESGVSGDLKLMIHGTPLAQRVDCAFSSEVPPAREIDRDGTCSLRREFPLAYSGEVTTTGTGSFLAAATLWDTSSASRPEWGVWWDSKQSDCGDRMDVWDASTSTLVLVSDGLGSGAKAARASRRAARTVEANPDEPLDVLMKKIHRNLKSTRGAVIFLGRIPHAGDRIEYCSVGNITARHRGRDRTQTLMSFNGTLGCNLSEISVRTSLLDEHAQIVLYTDGLELPPEALADESFLRRRPVTNSARLLHSFSTGDDDALVGTIGIRKV